MGQTARARAALWIAVHRSTLCTLLFRFANHFACNCERHRYESASHYAEHAERCISDSARNTEKREHSQSAQIPSRRLRKFQSHCPQSPCLSPEADLDLSGWF